MNKKILIGSIIAVAILIGVSFTSVVGYRSVASDVKASPLFNIRSSKMITKEDNDLNCNYLGINKDNTILVPKRNTERLVYQNVMDKLRKMDDESFNRCVQIAIYQLNMNHKMKDERITTLINQLKSNSNEYNLSDKYKDNDDMILDEIPSLDYWFPGCILFWVYWIIVWYLIIYRSFQSPCW